MERNRALFIWVLIVERNRALFIWMLTVERNRARFIWVLIIIGKKQDSAFGISYSVSGKKQDTVCLGVYSGKKQDSVFGCSYGKEMGQCFVVHIMKQGSVLWCTS